MAVTTNGRSGLAAALGITLSVLPSRCLTIHCWGLTIMDGVASHAVRPGIGVSIPPADSSQVWARRRPGT